jgi:N-acetylneuraminate synthase/sialic acid synthase
VRRLGCQAPEARQPRLFTRAAFDRPYDNENSFGPTYGLHREALELNRDEFRELKRYAEDVVGIDFFSTAFDIPSADVLADLDVPVFKIASSDLTNIPLLQHVARFGKPMIVSTGGGTMEDVERAHDAITPINSRFCLLQCTSSYPAEPEDLDLRVIETFRARFPETVIGYSGHDNGIAMPLVAYMLGARVVEKHFTLNRAMKGTDHIFSLEPVGLRKMVRDLTRARAALGDGVKKRHGGEVASMLKMGKSLYAARDLPAGHILTERDVAVKCPGGGLAPYELERIIGLPLAQPLATDDQLTFDVLVGEPRPAGAVLASWPR